MPPRTPSDEEIVMAQGMADRALRLADDLFSQMPSKIRGRYEQGKWPDNPDSTPAMWMDIVYNSRGLADLLETLHSRVRQARKLPVQSPPGHVGRYESMSTTTGTPQASKSFTSSHAANLGLPRPGPRQRGCPDSRRVGDHASPGPGHGIRGGRAIRGRFLLVIAPGRATFEQRLPAVLARLISLDACRPPNRLEEEE